MKEGCQTRFKPDFSAAVPLNKFQAEPEKAGQNRYFLDLAAICGKSSNKSHKIYDVMVFVWKTT